ncbi:universal stress protein [Eisenibacter elegans]|jgi:nucleotide-binding universal stress UspA family protein|uniref:universal stress protein n=1 Tax=Eisenibacter elegans TaxID=997 RepID=UPI0003FADA69|nr:universal stress protein [Eisenibacter elegans]
MTKIQKIVVPTDFSESAHTALIVAAQIASSTGASIDLLHIVPSISPTVLSLEDKNNPNSVENQYMEYVRQSSEEALKKLSKEPVCANLDIQTHLAEGDVFKTLSSFVTDNQSDLIVMGTRGASGLDEWLVGSNTEKVVRLSAVPVLAVREDQREFKPQHIVFATTFKDNQRKVLPYLQALQGYFKAHLHLLFVNTPSNFLDAATLQKRQEAFLSGAGLDNYTVHNYNYVTEELGITRFSEEVDADLVVMATNQRRGLAHYFLGSLAEDVVNHLKRPVLTLSLRS